MPRAGFPAKFLVCCSFAGCQRIFFDESGGISIPRVGTYSDISLFDRGVARLFHWIFWNLYAYLAQKSPVLERNMDHSSRSGYESAAGRNPLFDVTKPQQFFSVRLVLGKSSDRNV